VWGIKQTISARNNSLKSLAHAAGHDWPKKIANDLKTISFGIAKQIGST